MRLEEFLDIGDVEEVRGDVKQPVTGLACDSSRVAPGNLFFAVPGTRVDGHDFVPQAVERGAVAVVVERRPEVEKAPTWVKVTNVRRTMGRWAARYHDYPSRRLRLVGVTGTNGKTTVTYLLESIFAAAGMAPGVIGTINYRYQGKVFPALHTTPESIELQSLLAEMVRGGVKSVAMEVSSHALAQERVRGMDFDVALFTNLSRDHLDFHGDMEHYFLSKSRLFTDYLKESAKARKAAVIHGQDPRGRELAARTRDLGVEVFTYGRDPSWDVHPIAVESGLDSQKGSIRVQNRELEFFSRLIGDANLENILGAVAASLALALPAPAVAEGVAHCESVPGRLERVPARLGISVFVDYAHTPDALERVLQALRGLTRRSGSQVSGFGSGPETGASRLICLFGCGGDRDRGKRPLMGEIAARLSELVVLTSDNPRTEDPVQILAEIEAGVKKTGMKKLPMGDFLVRASGFESEKGYFVEPDRRAAIRAALRLARQGDLVLIAGKGHEDYQILGPKRIHFDDREVVKQELDQLMARS